MRRREESLEKVLHPLVKLCVLETKEQFSSEEKDRRLKIPEEEELQQQRRG